MIWFNSSDLWSIIIIILSLSLNIAITYPCFLYVFKKPNKFLPFFITTSVSVYIILGYLFYCFRSLNIYPIIYLVFFVFLNLYLLIKNKHHFHLNFRPKINQLLLVKGFVFLFLLSIISYYFFYDALRNITPDNYYDIHNHMRFFDTIKSDGQITMSYYAPGFHILFYPAYLILKGPNLYRFLGPVLGLLIILNLYLVSPAYFSKKSSRILFLILPLFPFFKLLSIQFVTLWPTTTSYLFLPTLIILLLSSNKLNSKKQLLLYTISLTSFSLTLPYALLQYVPVTVVVCLLSALFFRKTKSFHQLKYFLTISILTISATFIPVLHVFLQTQVVSKNGFFPEIQILKKENDKLIVSNVYQDTPSVKTISTTPISQLSNNIISSKIAKNYFLPLIATIKSALVPKVTVPFSKYSLKSYLYILISLFLAIFSIITKHHKLFILSGTSFLFGLITQFGFLELTQYRGRTGPYMVFLSLITAVYCYDQIKFCQPLLTSTVFLLILGIILKNKPLTFNREGLCPEIFEQFYLIAKKYPNQPLNIISRYSQISLLSPNITSYSLTEKDITSYSKKADSFLLLQENYCEQAPLAFLQANSHDPTYQYYLINKQNNLDLAVKITETIRQSPEFQNFKLYWKNQNISIYHRPKQTN